MRRHRAAVGDGLCLVLTVTGLVALAHEGSLRHATALLAMGAAGLAASVRASSGRTESRRLAGRYARMHTEFVVSGCVELARRRPAQ